MRSKELQRTQIFVIPEFCEAKYQGSKEIKIPALGAIAPLRCAGMTDEIGNDR